MNSVNKKNIIIFFVIFILVSISVNITIFSFPAEKKSTLKNINKQLEKTYLKKIIGSWQEIETNCDINGNCTKVKVQKKIIEFYENCNMVFINSTNEKRVFTYTIKGDEISIYDDSSTFSKIKFKILNNILILNLNSKISKYKKLPGPEKKYTKYFEINIKQGNAVVPITNHRVQMKKKSFIIDIIFNNISVIMVNASFSSDAYNSAMSGEPMNNIKGFYHDSGCDGLGMAEGDFNESNQIMIDDDAFNYWYYDSMKDHRFNKVIVKENKLYCERVINSLWVDRNDLMINEIKEKTLYLVFIHYEWSDKFKKIVRMQKEYLAIDFLDEQ